MAKFSLTMGQGGDDALADELERIAKQVREGFTSGYVFEGGEWSAETDPSPDRCSGCGALLENPSAAGAEDGICGECIEGDSMESDPQAMETGGDCETCAASIETRVAPCDECGALDEESE